MSALTDYFAAINALNGATDANGVAIIVRRNFGVFDTGSVAALFDYGPSGLDATAFGAPTVTAGAGPRLSDGSRMAAAILNGTTQYWDAGVIPTITPAIGGAKGLTIIAPVKRTNKTQRATLCSCYNSGASRNGGFDIAFNQAANGNPDTTNGVCNLQYGADATGFCDQAYQPLDGTYVDDSIWHLGMWYMNVSDAAHGIWKANCSNVSGQVTEPFGFNSGGSYLTTTGKFFVGALGLATSVFEINYNDPICALAIIEGKLTDAQCRAIMDKFGTTVDGIKNVKHHVKANAGFTGAEEGQGTKWTSQVQELAECTIGSSDGGGPSLIRAANGGVAAVSFDNMYQSTGSPTDAGLGGASYLQRFLNDSVEPMTPNRITLAAAIRLPVFQPQGATNLTWIECLDASNNVLAQLVTARHPGFGRGASVFIKDTGKFVRAGPSLVFVAATYEDGVTTIYADNLTGETPNNPGTTPARVTGKITKIRYGGQASGTGGMATGWMHEGLIASYVATAAEIATYRDAVFNRWKSNPRETVTNTAEEIYAGDSIVAGRAALKSKNFVMMKPVRHRGPRTISYGIAGDKTSDTITRDWSDAKKYLASASSSVFILETIVNDIVAYLSVGNPTPAAWKANATTVLDAYRAMRPTGKIVIMGACPCPGTGGSDPTTRNLFKAKALELVASYGNAAFLDLDGMTADMFDDSLHPNNAGHLYMAIGKGNGGLAAVLTALDPANYPSGGGIGRTSRTSRVNRVNRL